MSDWRRSGRKRELRILSTDGAFHRHETRSALRQIGVVENTHLSSHAKSKSAEKTDEERLAKSLEIDPYPTWHANGHREIACACGKGKTSRMVELDPETGKATARLKGECSECGNVLITSGLWLLSDNKKFVKRLSGQQDQAEWDFGNPLTFHDPLSKEYGVSRFSGQEGAFASQFTQRFRLLKDKRWFYRQTQVNLEVATVITITHALSLEGYRRKSKGKGLRTTGAAPPGVPEALAA